MPTAAGLYWEQHGKGSSTPVILSSGLGGSANYWRPNLAALAAQDVVVTYDHRGTGRSEREIAGALSVGGMADDILALMDALGIDRARIVGHAAGGLAGMDLALRFPERIESLAVINGWARLSPHTARCFDTRLALLRDSGPRAFLHAQPLFLYPPQWIAEHHDALVEEEEAQLAHFPGIEMMQRRIAAVRLFNIERRLAEIAIPSLFMVSEDDMLVPPGCSTTLANGVKNGKLARFGSGGHAVNVTRADTFNQWLLAWLAS
jgi:aminoacrylate hydrolase